MIYTKEQCVYKYDHNLLSEKVWRTKHVNYANNINHVLNGTHVPHLSTYATSSVKMLDA